MSVQAWNDAAGQSHGYRKAEYQHTVGILRSVFEGEIDSDGAATQINALYEPLLKGNHNNSPVNELWVIICEAVRILGANTAVDERLINLLNALTKLPDITDQHGHPITGGNGVDGVYWKDLPNLALMFREYGIDVDPGVSELPDNEGDWTDSQRTTLLNVTNFGAMYLASGIHPIGMELHAESSLMDGVEDPYNTPEQRCRADTVIPPAATWVLLAGEKIYKLCKNNHDRTELLGQYGRGYSLGRWNVWKKRFDLIATTEDLSDTVRDFAQRAAGKMDSIDGGLE